MSETKKIVVSDENDADEKEVSFEDMDFLLSALCTAFPYNDEEDEVDPRFACLWHTALYMAGWTEDEFWEAHEEEYSEEYECPKCKAEREAKEGKGCDDCDDCDCCDDDDEEEVPPPTKKAKVNKNLN